MSQLYAEGLSIDEIASQTGRSYYYTREKLLESGMALRSKAEGTRLYVSRHPEWSRQFVKHRVVGGEPLTETKVLLLAMMATEGYTDETSFGFTNRQDLLHAEFIGRVRDVYGDVHVGRNGLTSRVSSIEIARDLAGFLPFKTFNAEALNYIMKSASATPKVLRVIADTEGAFIISIKKAKRNFTVESRVVLASSNPRFTAQIGTLLDAVGIEHRVSSLGAIIYKKSQIARFIEGVGFTPGVKVVRRKGVVSNWYGAEKAGLQNLFLKVSFEQKRARAMGIRGCFADCLTRDQTFRRLRSWYAEVNGGGES